ncbi:SPFH domain-containing protein [Desulfopila aestuarii]|uniref:Regulator of protease activity HflC, stomatin/prohibitin superfamily n=1 Tax=Desulfopila aestuarii DSM 18488 TaxID=1121416 RepID=A0A1M7Y9K5_9BACT|nr:SPFH domain-containing protein [Desulfopila aestuarii]SHO49312.1 Regulator of protease activity HflC, stomatin/prohibitin superfamily [Desulfopila aestuarii DSM 18488]
MSDKPVGSFVQRAFVFRILRLTLLLILLIVIGYGLIVTVYASRTIFKVKMNYAVVLERLGGHREAVTEVGWHVRLPYFTRIEQEVTLMNQTVFLGDSVEPMRIITRENVTLWASALLTFRIRDLNIWAIENQEPMVLLQGDYDGLVKDKLQSQTVASLISDREMVKEKIFKSLKASPINEGGPTLEEKYGIEVISFVLRETRFGDKLVEASEEKKKRELIAEAENYAADQEASRIRKLYAAYVDGVSQLLQAVGQPDGRTDTALLQFLDQQRWAAAYEKNQTGQNTVVIQNTDTAPAVTLPPLLPANAQQTHP